MSIGSVLVDIPNGGSAIVCFEHDPDSISKLYSVTVSYRDVKLKEFVCVPGFVFSPGIDVHRTMYSLRQDIVNYLNQLWC
jgi:hypothetical protein